MQFTLYMLDRYGANIEQLDELIRAGKALTLYLDIMRNSGVRLNQSSVHQLMDLCMCHLVAAERLDISFVPKHHAWMHMTHRHTNLIQ